MFDFSFAELALIVGVALVVIGPKDLPKVMRTVRDVARKVRAMASEARSSVDEFVREAELEEVRTVANVMRFDVKAEIARHLDPVREIKTALGDAVLTSPQTEAPQASSPAVPPPAAPLPAPHAAGEAKLP